MDTTATACLADEHDLLLLDLDGTLIRGNGAVPHATGAIAQAQTRGSRPVVVTNNASRSPSQIVNQLGGLGFALSTSDVFTSPQAACQMLSDECPAGSPVLVVGSEWLRSTVSSAGFVPVLSADANPIAVVQGFSPDIGWSNLVEACLAIRSGARWIATNRDPTFPTDRGLVPSNGAFVAALESATNRTPDVAGKPESGLYRMVVADCLPRSPLAVGDRISTDIAAATSSGIPSLLVLTGVTSPFDLLSAKPSERPAFLSWDLRGLIDSRHCVSLRHRRSRNTWHAQASGSTVMLRCDLQRPGPLGPSELLAALAELCHEAWLNQSAGVSPADECAAAAIDELGNWKND